MIESLKQKDNVIKTSPSNQQSNLFSIHDELLLISIFKILNPLFFIFNFLTTTCDDANSSLLKLRKKIIFKTRENWENYNSLLICKIIKLWNANVRFPCFLSNLLDLLSSFLSYYFSKENFQSSVLKLIASKRVFVNQNSFLWIPISQSILLFTQSLVVFALTILQCFGVICTCRWGFYTDSNYRRQLVTRLPVSNWSCWI